jgi:hypothetical protein
MKASFVTTPPPPREIAVIMTGEEASILRDVLAGLSAHSIVGLLGVSLTEASKDLAVTDALYGALMDLGVE